MIDALHLDPDRVARAYNRRRRIYARTVAQWERPHHVTALAAAAVRPGDRVLEVAVGPGFSLIDLARAAGAQTPVSGVDLSPRMLDLARATLASAGVTGADLRVADAAALPFPDGTFDVLYNAYMLDLIPTETIPRVLAEFRRVLRPGGRLVLLNMSKRDHATRTRRERIYRYLPQLVVLYLMGGCRPVLVADLAAAAGFTDVERTYLPEGMPSELVIATR